MENRYKGIKVTALCPGFTYSEFHDVSGTREMISQLPDYFWLQAEDVIADCIEAMDAEKVKPIVVPGRQYKIMVFIARYLPWLARMIARKNARYFRKTD